MPNPYAWPDLLLPWVEQYPGLAEPLRDALAAAWEAGRAAGFEDVESGRNPWLRYCRWPSSPCTRPRAVGQLCPDHADMARALLTNPQAGVARTP